MRLVRGKQGRQEEPIPLRKVALGSYDVVMLKPPF